MNANPPSGPGKKPDNPFFEIKDAILVAKIFDAANKYHIPVTLWLRNQTVRLDTELTYEGREYKTIVAIFPKDISTQVFDEALRNQGSNEILGQIIIDATTFFFKTTCLALKGAKLLKLAVPDSIFKFQRRSNLRIPFQRAGAPKVTVYDPTKPFQSNTVMADSDMLTLRMLDLSAGGCALAARVEDRDKFVKDATLHDMRFLLRGMEIVTQGLVKHVAEALNDKGKPMLRIGVQFKGIRLEYERQIAQFVMDESRRIFTLLK